MNDQPKIQVRQESTFITVDYFPDPDNLWLRYSVGKGTRLTDSDVNPFEVMPAEISSPTKTNMTAREAAQAITLLGMLVNLALQLDKLITKREDFGLPVKIEQTGTFLLATWEGDREADLIASLAEIEAYIQSSLELPLLERATLAGDVYKIWKQAAGFSKVRDKADKLLRLIIR